MAIQKFKPYTLLTLKILRRLSLFLCTCTCIGTFAQAPVNLDSFNKKSPVTVTVNNSSLQVVWPADNDKKAGITLSRTAGQPLISALQYGDAGGLKNISQNLQPVFVLTTGKRDLVSQNGWNIFFDKTAYLPSKSFEVKTVTENIRLISSGTATKIVIGSATAGNFSGNLEITLYEGSPLLNIAAVMKTGVDSTAIIYDAGLVNSGAGWNKLFYADTDNYIQEKAVSPADEAANLAVKYRTIVAESSTGSVAVFPAPHQFFPPLDNCYNLAHTWYGNNYRNTINGYGIGIRQDLLGDRRWVPWFNAPPGTEQRLNFFCLLSDTKDGKIMEDVKAFTHADTYAPLKGYYTFCSHFHVEHTDDVLTHKPLPETPGFVKAFRNTGVNIVHLAEFHGPGDPRGPDVKRLEQLNTLFKECRRLSGGNFLMLPGEEPNNFFGGHWVNIFPKPVYWVMSKNNTQQYVYNDSLYGKVYHIGNKEEMLQLLKDEKGLAWTAHARTKGSTGFPDAYKNEAFYLSDRFNGAAWKAMPADLSQPRLGKRILDLQDDMNNWGQPKRILAEADLFKIEPNYELYAHLNVNYLQLDKMPSFEEGWQPVVDALEKGKFFCSTGEVLLPVFNVNGKGAGDTAQLRKDGKDELVAEISWTFPLHFAEIISGDGKETYKEKIWLNDTRPFGKKLFRLPVQLAGRKWVRLEVWDAAVNGAFTQTIWLK
ncbi:hypothetical protein [Foetidibacter luteolus]|uniref:hypothetical protein n=1 Tax=Foetidibacter luteolus TaxID=2608880 RepID=UPI001F3E3EA7|nr:hypothetical protein [Foetidibacter luteolus]